MPSTQTWRGIERPVPPYASAIIPTHDRASTLPVALGSIARQTVSNIEIIVVGDGATDEVVAAAEAFAEADKRVRFLRFDKGENDGGINRDRGVLAARSERIFYCDDDDVWLPQHVETLGPHLDGYDIVDTLAVSVGIVPIAARQRLHGALINHGNSRARTLLAEHRLKLIFDTHLAHRKSRYIAMGRPWLSPESFSIEHFLAAFAADDSVRWTTLPTATALSLHGLGRRYATAAERVAEIERWLVETVSWTPDHLIRQANFGWYFFRLLAVERPLPDDTIASYLARMGIRWDGMSSPGDAGSGGLMSAPLDLEQRRPLELMFELNQGRTVDEGELAIVVLQLLDIVLGNVVSVQFAMNLLTPFGLPSAIEAVRSMERTYAESAHVTTLLEAHLLRKAGRYEEARAAAERLLGEERLPRYELTRLLAMIEVGLGEGGAAIERMSSAWEQMPEQTAVGLELAGMLIAVGRRQEALSLCRQLEPVLPQGHSGLRTLYQRLGVQTEASQDRPPA
jgi:glycosyltransferase involved in cell wall biosynthesis